MTTSMEMEIQRSLGRLEAKVDQVLSQQVLATAHRESISGRVRKLETWQTKITTAVGAGGFVVGILASVIYKLYALVK